MASTDEETGLKSGEKSEDQDLDPDRDPELKKNGGRFDSKKAILQVTWRFPVDFKDPLNIIALIYGYLPFVIPLVFFIDMVVERRFIAFYGLAVSGVVTLINEVILKELLKQPRPYGSANRKFNEKTKKWEMKPGMPSGHVLNATTTMVWCLLEVSLRGPGFDDHPFMTGKLLLLILVCMAPVPWARIYNQDHSLAQCTVAGVLGVFAGLMAYWVRYHYFPLQAEKEWCVSKWCLVSGKPWDPFLPEGDALVTAASGVTTMVSTTLQAGFSSLATAAAGEKLKLEELPDSRPLGLELMELRVIRVHPWGAKHGWQVGDIIVDIAGHPVKTFEELWDRIQVERNRPPVRFTAERWNVAPTVEEKKAAESLDDQVAAKTMKQRVAEDRENRSKSRIASKNIQEEMAKQAAQPRSLGPNAIPGMMQGYDDDEYEDDEDYSYYSEDDSRVMTAQRVNFPTGRFKSRFTAVFEVIENDKDKETSQHRPGTPNVVIEQKPEKKVKVVVQEEAVDTSKPTDDEKTRVFPVDFERRTFHRDKVVFTKDAWGRSVVKVMNPTQRKPDL